MNKCKYCKYITQPVDYSYLLLKFPAEGGGQVSRKPMEASTTNLDYTVDKKGESMISVRPRDGHEDGQ